MAPLLKVSNLSLTINSDKQMFPVVSEVSFEVDENQTLGIVGESGCGKSLTSLAIMGLLDDTPIRLSSGSINFAGKELTSLSKKKRRAMMGDQIAMIFQEPMTSLNPVYRVGEQIVEVLRHHRQLSKSRAMDKTVELLELVRIDEPERRVYSFPHQMSGGQRQRVMIAMALACEPKLLIADEPTTALDVTVQEEVLNLIGNLQKQMGMALILISHDLGVIAKICDVVSVMYRGKIVEACTTDELFSNMHHPYTRGLLNSLPLIDGDLDWLEAIPGRVPTIEEHIPGCTFHPRCKLADRLCQNVFPDLKSIKEGHTVRCHHSKPGGS